MDTKTTIDTILLITNAILSILIYLYNKKGLLPANVRKYVKKLPKDFLVEVYNNTNAIVTASDEEKRIIMANAIKKALGNRGSIISNYIANLIVEFAVHKYKNHGAKK